MEKKRGLIAPSPTLSSVLNSSINSFLRVFRRFFCLLFKVLWIVFYTSIAIHISSGSRFDFVHTEHAVHPSQRVPSKTFGLVQRMLTCLPYFRKRFSGFLLPSLSRWTCYYLYNNIHLKSTKKKRIRRSSFKTICN